MVKADTKIKIKDKYAMKPVFLPYVPYRFCVTGDSLFNILIMARIRNTIAIINTARDLSQINDEPLIKVIESAAKAIEPSKKCFVTLTGSVTTFVSKNTVVKNDPKYKTLVSVFSVC